MDPELAHAARAGGAWLHVDATQGLGKLDLEGFIAALLESFTGKKFTVKEIDCWCTGDRTCRFEAIALPGGAAP